MIIKKKNQKSRGAENEITPVNDEILPEDNSDVSENDAAEVDSEIDDVSQNIQEESEISIKEPDEDLFDIENIDFTQRQERRRGSRRRGYRRIDDRNLVSRAQEEADLIKKSAFEEGYKKGLEQSGQDIEAFKGNLKAYMNATKDVFEYIAPDILEISVNIAKKIIKKEIESDPQTLVNMIIEVLKTVSKSEPKVNIRVKPQAVQFIKDTLPNIAYEYGIEAKVNIVADPSVEDGGCIFQTNNGIVDASIDTQLEIIKKALDIG